MSGPRIALYDTTLRDGAQGAGISFSAPGKLRVARRLDELGVDYIEGGFAASNPKDMEFFRAARKEKFRHARVAAFGSTRRANVRPAEDRSLLAILEAGTPVATIFGKSWLLHVREVLKTTDEENLAMIRDSVRFLKEHGKEVIYDAEHFFDGWKDDAAYARRCLQAAAEGGADALVLCDTNGGCLPHEAYAITRAVVADFGGIRIGIHTHNDSETGVANSIEAVRAGASHVQGTINGFGERCGNANLCSIIPILALKLGRKVLARPDRLAQLREVSQFVYELANVRPDSKLPFVGDDAFAHKAGMHVDAVRKVTASFEHIPPEKVGNQRRVLVSELSGASNVFLKAVELGLQLSKNSPEVKDILHEMERQERNGYEFEAADASFRLMIQKVLKRHKPFFELVEYKVDVHRKSQNEPSRATATVKLKVKGHEQLTAGEGDGPVDALNNALRKALEKAYPQIRDVHLTDYQVRILDPEESTGAKTRVLITSSDGRRSWGTVGVSTNIIEASWEALVDSVEYKLFLDEQETKKRK